MAALTVRLPDEKHMRLKALAKSRGAPLNRLIEEMNDRVRVVEAINQQPQVSKSRQIAIVDL